MKQLSARCAVYLFLLMVMLIGSSQAEPATKWDLSKAHSSVTFKIWHMMTPVYGSFDDFDADIHFDPQNLAGSSIKVTIQIPSINTGWGPRDEHLQSEDWFDAGRYPDMTFTSSEITSTGDDTYVAKGTLKMKGVEKEIELPFKLLGIKELSGDMKETFGDADEVASFEISNYSVNRKDYKVGTGTSTRETAAIVYSQVVGSEVNINIAIEVTRKTS
jgi:polyisoprenoid-binding protein YceI